MKRAICAMLALLILIGGTTLAGAEAGNPWTPTTAQGLMDALGLQLGLPDGAANVSWQMLEARQMGQVRFTWQGEDYTARIAPTDVFEDISGLYYEWDDRQDCSVGRCPGVCCRARADGNTVDLCLWYDELTGLMYSVSVIDKELDGFDIRAAAEKLYIPMQTE